MILEKKVNVKGYFIHHFATLRAADGISPMNIAESLDAQLNRASVFKSGEASGASGSFFFSVMTRTLSLKL